MKLTLPQKRLLFEAYRRNEMKDAHEQTKPLDRRWLGLGSAAAYRPAMEAGLMTWAASIPAHRCMGWVRLTEKGVEVFKEYEPEFKQIMERMNASGYQKTLLSQYTLAGGLLGERGDRGF